MQNFSLCFSNLLPSDHLKTVRLAFVAANGADCPLVLPLTTMHCRLSSEPVSQLDRDQKQPSKTSCGLAVDTVAYRSGFDSWHPGADQTNLARP